MANQPKHSRADVVELLAHLPTGEVIDLVLLLASLTEASRGVWSKTNTGASCSIRRRPKGQKNGDTIGPRETVLDALEDVMLKRFVTVDDPVVVIVGDSQFERLVRALLMFLSRNRSTLIATLVAILGGWGVVSFCLSRSSLVSASTLKLSAVGQPVPTRSTGDADKTPRKVVISASHIENATKKDAVVASARKIPVERPTWAGGRLGDLYFELLKAGNVTVTESWSPALWGVPDSLVARGDFTCVADGDARERVLRSLGMGDATAVITDRPYSRDDLFTLVKTALGTDAIALFGRKADGSCSIIFTHVRDARQLAEAMALIARAPGSPNGAYLSFTGAILRYYSSSVTLQEYPVGEPLEMRR